MKIITKKKAAILGVLIVITKQHQIINYVLNADIN